MKYLSDPLDPSLIAADYVVAALGVETAWLALAALRAEWLTPAEANRLRPLAEGIAQILGREVPPHRGVV